MSSNPSGRSSDSQSSNFWILAAYAPDLAKLGMRAEQYFSDDPNTCLIKIRQFAELLAQTVAANVGMYTSTQESQLDLLRRLDAAGHLNADVARVFHDLRKIGNQANHNLHGSAGDSLSALKMARQLAVWYHRATRDINFKSGPFIPPAPPADASTIVTEELERLQVERDKAIKEAVQTREEKEALGKLAQEKDRKNEEITAQLEALQAKAQAHPAQAVKTSEQLSKAASVKWWDMDEAATRTLIDQQLRDAGWEADTTMLRYALGTRPEKGRNMAIAEWPTETGRADYVLFVGLTPVATVEAKKGIKNVAEDIKQAKRYSGEFKFTPEMQIPEGSPWADGRFRVPFGFSTNGRQYLKQHETESGLWFVDMRRATNHARAIGSWYSPQGLQDLLRRDRGEAEKNLEEEKFDYGFTLRGYQQNAVLAVENALVNGTRICLLAMATGTGKTKTAIALMYRLLKSKMFKRVLFVVDRSALGEQAARDFDSTRMENLQNFSNIFGVKEIDDRKADKDTSVHIATIQGLIRRVFYSDSPPPVDEYDCIIIDECHRGYLLDRDLSGTELYFRDQNDYISNYRRVIEYFDAVKIGLTATPALHTVEIFGEPVFSYTYREAVLDEVLIDHEPPITIVTELSENGIKWKAGEKVKLLKKGENKIEHFTTSDDIALEVEDFNRKVITSNFNRVVCRELARQIDVPSKEKTVIFCATDAHADLVVTILKEELKTRYGEVDDDAVVKITGQAHAPLKLIRQFKNESLPQVAVTVDLLTTGIDVPPITNLVFIRTVTSRILYEQMLGRATRRCDEIGKEVFRIYDAVGIYKALQDVTDMKPVVVNPKMSFTELARELQTIKDVTHLELARDQFLVKLIRKKRHMREKPIAEFEVAAGQSVEAFIKELRRIPVIQLNQWFCNHANIGKILDGANRNESVPSLLVSEHSDTLLYVNRGYGHNQKPEDYLDEFAHFIKTNGNTLPAMQAVLQRPRDLTRKDLKALALALSDEGFDERSLQSAWAEKSNKDIAAGIIGYIRQAALGDPLVPWRDRVEFALRKILASRSWTVPQKQWLEKIAAQTKANVVVDKDVMDSPDQMFKREAGGFNAINKKFDGELEEILHHFNELIWSPEAS
ncbi:MAG: type I restriction-modification system endonuclease [Candidatus Obscuribacterales bacterium]|nr:type I restriction-modification system endonuclease [Candidatus Obscuribacterales bacterium]